MKKILAIVLCFALVFSLAACKGGEQVPTGDGNGTGEQQGSTEINGGDGTSIGNAEGTTSKDGTGISTENTNGTSSNNGGASSSGNSGSTSADSGTVSDNKGTTNTDNPPNSNETTDYAKTVFNTERVKSTSSGVAVNDLSNTYYKLNNNKKLTIGYTGGSVTDGSGGTNGCCWRTEVTKWFKDTFPDAEITEVDGSQGNKSSYWGFFRIDDWTKPGQKGSLIEMKPDLVFLEFAINDYYVRMSDNRTVHYMEGMIRKIRNALPQTDIVIIFITDEGYIGKVLPTVPSQKELADYYGIPTIDVGAAMNEYLKSTGKSFDEMYADNVHPNNRGHKFYAEVICDFLKEKFDKNSLKTGNIKNCQMPDSWFLSNGSCESEIKNITELTKITKLSGTWRELDVSGNAVNAFGPQLYGTTGSEIEFEFDGTGFGFMVDARTSSIVKCQIDGKETIFVTVLNGIHNELPIAENLAPGRHKAKVTIVTGERFIIGALFVEK